MTRKTRFFATDAAYAAWRRALFLLFALPEIAPTGASARPEAILLDVLTRPFAPLEWASPECRRDAAAYLQGLQSYAPWALQMYDASAKIPPGVITGNYQQLGNYDECLRIESQAEFVGQACSATVQFDIAEDDGSSRNLDIGDLLLSVAIASNATKWTSGNTVQYEWMICVPSTCNHTEIQEALEVALDPLKVEGRVDMVVNLPKESCHTKETDRATFDIADCVYISILMVFALIIVASTAYDVAKQSRLSTVNRQDTKRVIFSSFSLYTNCKNLLRTDRRGDSIGCLDGLRYLSICWIIYGHTHYHEVVDVKIDLSRVPHMHHDWSTLLVLNGNIVTDTFFLLSGILLAYTEMLKKQKNAKWRFDVIGLYVHRYLRLTPAYAMMIGFYSTLLYKVGTGPHWDNWVGQNKEYCRENWWVNLLYVNNYVNVPTMCMSQSWYLSTDMQLFWLSPILLYPMLKCRRRVFFWTVACLSLLFSILTPFLITFYLQLTGTMLYYKEQSDVVNVYRYIYTRVYNRAGPYIIGLCLGYLLYKTHTYRVRIPLCYVTCGWIIASVAGLSAVFGPVGMYYDHHVYDRVEASFYAGLHRPVFAASVSWIIFATVHGYGGIVGHFLSWRGWTPLSKLTYSAYLCHYVFLLTRSGSMRTAGNLTPMNVIYVFCGNLALTMVLSVLWTLSFEMPFMILDRALFSSKKRHDVPNLSAKVEQAKIFDSSVSGKEIYRPTDETSSTISQITYDTDYPTKISDDSVYNSVGNVSYVADDADREIERKDGGSAPSSSSASNLDSFRSNLNSSRANVMDSGGPSYIYVINGFESGKSGWPCVGPTASNRQGHCGYLDGSTSNVDLKGYPYGSIEPTDARSAVRSRRAFDEQFEPKTAKTIAS